MALHPGRMMEKPERQPYIHWTTFYDFEETRNIELCSYRGDDLRRYQNEKEEAKNIVGRHQEICRTGLTGKRREVWNTASGGWSQREKQRCQRSLSCKAAANRQKKDLLEEKEKHLAQGVEEIRSPQKKVIRVEPEETQDYVREAKSAEQEEVEERIFVPSAKSVPQKPLFRCDNQCSEKTLSHWQLASVVIDEGEESYTTNLCQMCFHISLKAKGEKPLTDVQWRQAVQKKAYPGRIWRMMGKEPYARGMWEYFLQDRNRVQRFRDLAEEEKQAGIQGQWQLESPAREYLSK